MAFPIHQRKVLLATAQRPPRRRPVDPRTGRVYEVVSGARPVDNPPRALRRAKLDNLAIVPASLLPFKAKWQALANSLPVGSAVIVLPSKPGAARATLERVSSQLTARGASVMTIVHDHDDGWEVRPL